MPTITVSPGALSLSQSTISVSGASVVSGSTRTLTVDLKKYNLIVEDDFFVSLEWIKFLKGEGLYFCGGVYNADSYVRQTSQGNWEKIDYFGLGFYTTVSYEK